MPGAPLGARSCHEEDLVLCSFGERRRGKRDPRCLRVEGEAWIRPCPQRAPVKDLVSPRLEDQLAIFLVSKDEILKEVEPYLEGADLCPADPDRGAEFGEGLGGSAQDSRAEEGRDEREGTFSE